jgi:hypothetical protein
MTRFTFWIASLTVLALSALVAHADDKPAAMDLNVAWTDLGSVDEAKAARALLTLSAAPKEAVALLGQELKPVKIDTSMIAKMVQDLDSNDLKTREAATRELAYLGKYAKPELDRHSKKATSEEVKHRIADLLERLPVDEKVPAPPMKLTGNTVGVNNVNGNITIIIDGKPLDLTKLAPPPPALPNVGWLRASRAAALLEHIGTPAAKEILQRQADGEADAPPTKAARDSLNRLKDKAR